MKKCFAVVAVLSLVITLTHVLMRSITSRQVFAQTSPAEQVYTYGPDYDCASDPICSGSSTTPVSNQSNAMMLKRASGVNHKMVSCDNSITNFDVSVDQGTAIVVGAASLVGNGFGQSFVWRWRVYNPDGSTFASKTYPENIITKRNQADLFSNFADVIFIPPGASSVVLTLFMFPKGTALTLFDDDFASNAYVAAHVSTKIKSGNQ